MYSSADAHFSSALLTSFVDSSLAVLASLHDAAPEGLLDIAKAHRFPGISSKAASSSISATDAAQQLESMRQRWEALVATPASSGGMHIDEPPPSESRQESGPESMPIGWTLYEAARWKPCPIGMLPGGVLPDLAAVH